jgi:transcriptional regulator with XRE-family HTH domain
LLKEHTLSYILENYRKQEKLNLRQFEDLVGLSFSYLGKIESGKATPSKSTLINLARNMGESPYRLLVAAEFQVDLIKDLSIRDIHLQDHQIINLLKRYRIYALGHLKNLIELKGLSRFYLTRLNHDYDRFINIVKGEFPLSIEETQNLCNTIRINFTDAFKLVKVDYDNELVGDLEDGEMALQLSKYIESKKQIVEKETITAKEKNSGDENQIRKQTTTSIAALEMTKDQILEFEIIDDNLTLDEVIYLRESLDLYRRLRLGSK